MFILLFHFITDAFDFDINLATQWHDMNNRGWKPTVDYNLNITALKGLNITHVYRVHYSTPLGLQKSFLVSTVGCTHGYSNITPSG